MKKKLDRRCKKCPYQLGEVKTLINPCPECKENGYNMMEVFKTGRSLPIKS